MRPGVLEAGRNAAPWPGMIKSATSRMAARGAKLLGVVGRLVVSALNQQCVHKEARSGRQTDTRKHARAEADERLANGVPQVMVDDGRGGIRRDTG
ncbi:MAG TPA: hypothetical protein VMQ65_01010 [Candidatus Limnocylindria bacterium]|nr:hypothetical protein [Candidatus Limnocylindria bacterium]